LGFRTLRNLLDDLGESLQKQTDLIDQCLLKHAEFSNAQDELSAWLTGMESSIKNNAELCATLQEKIIQLQVYMN